MEFAVWASLPPACGSWPTSGRDTGTDASGRIARAQYAGRRGSRRM